METTNSTDTQPEPIPAQALVVQSRAMRQIPVQEVRERREAIVQLMREAMTATVDYGVIPGCLKPSLFQPGAQKLLNLFQLDPEFEAMPDSKLEDGFILHSYKCTLYHAPSGLRIASGVGSCNSREEKYGMRTTKRSCPQCNKATIIKGKEEWGGGWVCWKKPGKSDGCGAKFRDGDPAIEGQPEGKVKNENIWEQENTIRKMAQKRSLIAATLNATGASDIFTQDVEDMAEFQGISQEESPAHREGHEHFTTYCKQCQDLKQPKDCQAVLLKGHIYLRDSSHDPVEPHEAFCPEPKCVAARDGNKPPEQPKAKPAGKQQKFTGADKVWMEHMESCQQKLGKAVYFRILGSNGFENASDVKDDKDRLKIRQEMLQAFEDARAFGAPVVP